MQELKIWSEVLVKDEVTQITQRFDIAPEQFKEGLLRNYGLSAQQYNQLMYLLSSYAAPSPICPFLFPEAAPIPTIALEMDGQVIVPEITPELSAAYGSTLPNLKDEAPAGFTYLVRKQ